ncbi:MAG: CotH kinase family protein [Oscillospiraceae bacterium]|nr:CotH kinase family protein [Oscillospiraceae bacterium]
MSHHKYTDIICIAVMIICIIISVIFMNSELFGIEAAANTMGYENRIFDTSKVHTVDIVMNDWESFIAACENEEYSDCTVVIDGESFPNTAIRAKGNTSLSNVSSMESDRYSFKLEFDHYDNNKSYYGLDKLSLNNVIQDNTYMKDYLTYRMMYDFGADAPLCSYAYITVNGKDFGLYLAVEAIEDSFLMRNYGKDTGELYKPDSMSFGGGRGNGKDFDIDNFINKDNQNSNAQSEITAADTQTMPQSPHIPQADPDPSQMFGEQSSDNTMQNGRSPFDRHQGDRNGDMGGMGSDDVKLKYIDDSPDSYSNIFDNAKTDITDTDKTRLIASLKSLNENTDIEQTVDIDEVIRYFVVHNYVCNGDSYTGSMIHNYYLYEKDGQLSMIPWDYNLAYGTFQGGNASEQINSPIDTPVSGGSVNDRPMLAWIFSDSTYTEMYHKYFSEFINTVDTEKIISEAYEIIAPYVKNDPTKFCTYEEFEKGVSTLKQFCTLRSESVTAQLNGTIPTTSEGQSADSTSLIDTSGITLSDMGTMSHEGMGGGRNFGARNTLPNQETTASQQNISDTQSPTANPDTAEASSENEISTPFTPPSMPDDFNWQNTPENFTPPQDMQGNFDPENMPEGFAPPTMEEQTQSAMPTYKNFQSENAPSAEPSAQADNSKIVLSGISAFILLIGIFFALKYRRKI